MRKITSLLMLLCMFVGTAWAQTQEVVKIYKPTRRVSELKTDGTRYMIFNTTKLEGNRYGFVYNNGNGGLNKPVSTPTGFEALSNAYLFTLEASTTEGAYYIKSVSNGKYVNHKGNTNNATGQDCYIYKFLDSPYKNTDANGQYMSKDDDATFIKYADLTEDQCLFSIGNEKGGDWNVWNGTEGGFSTWSTAHPYAFYEVEETEEIVTTTAITELANVSNNKLYIIKNARTANTALVYNGGANVVWNGKETSVIYDPRSNNFRWAIYKSSNSKYYLYNIGAGKYMGSAITKDAAIPFVDASGLHSVVIEKSSDNKDFPFMMSTNNKTGALNTNAGLQQGVVNWRDGYSHTEDAGNSFAFYEVADIPGNVLTTIEAAVADYEANGVANWKNIHAANGYVGHYPLSTQNAYNAIANEGDIDNFMYENNVVTFATGKYYRLVCVAPKTKNGDASYNTLTYNGASHLVTAPMNAADPNQIFVFETKGSNYKLKNLNANAYLNKISAGDYRSQVVSADDQIAEIQLRNVACAQYELQSVGGYCLYAENHATESVPHACSGWSDGKNSPSAWYIIPATELDITIGPAGWGTIYLPFDVTVPNTVNAYAVTGTNNEWATLTKKSDIQANKGAILEGEGTHTFTIGKADSDWNQNLLKGTTVNSYVDDKIAYVLAKDKEGIGFYKAKMNKNETGADGETHFLNNANKAYLVVEGASARFLSFDFGNETAIENIEGAANAANAVIYDLSGRRVQKTQKGLYIVNGVKVIK